MSWDYNQTYVAACGRAFSTRAEGIEHERHCPECQQFLERGDQFEEEDEE